jgi:hypothetical protein
MSSNLSKTEKIVILRSILFHLENKQCKYYKPMYVINIFDRFCDLIGVRNPFHCEKYGLCAFFLFYLENYGIDTVYFKIGDFFSDFTYKNAIKFNAKLREGGYWWSMFPYDFKNRIEFVAWMINRIRFGKEGKDE